jgi:predicted dithiol-disulfide oxidoreductase (DUF899 family)
MGTGEWWTELKSITLHVDGESPRLWPEGADDEYRRARLELEAADKALRDQVEAVAEMRRRLPPGAPVGRYEVVEAPAAGDGAGRPVTLLDLFGDHPHLVVYHLMFHPEDTSACAACSMFVDGLDGVARHITRRAGLAVMAPAPISAMRSWARHRGWRRVRLVSAAGTTFLDDLGVTGSRGALFPAFSVWAREGDAVRHVLTRPADFADGSGRGMDQMSPVWNVFDLLPSGRGDDEPDNTYPVAGTP